MEENTSTKESKLTYEQLEQVAEQLSEQTRQLYNQLKSASLNNMFKRLDYLFKVVENSIQFPDDFVSECVSEIVNTITIKEDTENTPEKS